MSVLNVPLAVRLQNGSVADDHVSVDVRRLAFRSVIPGGFASCEVELERPLNLSAEEISVYGKLYVYDGRSGAVVWQGRLEDPGRGSGPQGQIWTVRAIGPSAHTRDRMVKLIYVDKSIARWVPITELAAAPTENTPGHIDEPGGDLNDNPFLRFRANTGFNFNSGDVFGRWHREIEDAGQQIARISYDQDAGRIDASLATEVVVLQGATDVSEIVANTDTFHTTGSSVVVLITTDFSNQDVAILRIKRVTGGSNPPDETYWGKFINFIIRATRYDKGGSELVAAADYSTDTILASEVVEDLVGRLLDQYDGDAASIAATTYAIDQLTYLDPADAASIFADMIAIEPDFYWAAWEDVPASGKSRFEWRQWPATVRYHATAKDGFESPGSSAELYNRVVVRWRDAFDRIRRTVRTQTVTELDDAGLTREASIDLGDVLGSSANADQAGDKFLAEHLTRPNAGTLIVSAPIWDADQGRMVNPWEIVPGHLISVRDVLPRVDSLNPTAKDAVTVFRLVGANYDAGPNKAQLELDSSPRTLDRMTAPLAIAEATAERRR